MSISHTQVMSLFHSSTTKAFCTIKCSHAVITFAAQPFHWGETERRGGRSGEENGWGGKQKHREQDSETESERKREKTRSTRKRGRKSEIGFLTFG